MSRYPSVIKNLDAIILDFDGVILESLDIKGQIFAELFAEYPGHVDVIVKFHLMNGGVPRAKKIEYIFNNILKETLELARRQRILERFADISITRMAVCPFVEGAESFIKKYGLSVPLYVVSAAPEKEIVAIIDKRGLKRYFKGIHGTPGSKREHMENILSVNRYDRDSVIGIGDSLEDYYATAEAGIIFVGRAVNGNRKSFAGCCVNQWVLDLREFDDYCHSNFVISDNCEG